MWYVEISLCVVSSLLRAFGSLRTWTSHMPACPLGGVSWSLSHGTRPWTLWGTPLENISGTTPSKIPRIVLLSQLLLFCLFLSMFPVNLHFLKSSFYIRIFPLKTVYNWRIQRLYSCLLSSFLNYFLDVKNFQIKTWSKKPSKDQQSVVRQSIKVPAQHWCLNESLG